jgi:hypothetical protein
MYRHVFPIALLVFLGVLCAASGCTPQEPAQQVGDSTAPATDVMRMAALCNEHGGEWIKQRGCRMTEKLCTSTYHGSWQDPNCAVPASEVKDCNQAGGQPAATGACLINFLTLDASQYMK